MQILLIGSNTAALSVLGGWCREEKYTFEFVLDEREGIEFAKQHKFDLVIFLASRDEGRCTGFAHSLRQSFVDTLLLVVAQVDNLTERVHTFDAGADGWIAWPVRHEEFFAIARALIRRSRGHASSTVEVGDVTVELARKKVFVRGNEVKLKPNEYRTLELLALHKGSIVSEKDYVDYLYGDNVDAPRYAAFHVRVCELRKKISAVGGRHGIETLRGLGYRLSES